jgi:coenzyme F420-reducing hydrogenase beta subunit
MARMDSMEEKVHGRKRKVSDMVWSSTAAASSNDEGVAEEARFGVLHRPVTLARGTVEGAQWTGCVTGIALAALESGMVDAVVCISNQEGGKWSSPEPIVARTAEMVLKGRGVKPALAPSLRVLDEIKADDSIRKLLFCGVGCAVQGTCVIAEYGALRTTRLGRNS